MAKEEIEISVKSNIGSVNKDAKALAGEFQIMGVSLNSLKAGFVTMASTAKKSFATIKAGLMSTGIGALVVVLGSVITYFTKTEKGAEKLKVVFAGIGSAVSVITDRISKFGGAIVKLFKKDWKGAAKDLKATFSGITEEIKEEVTLMMKLEKQANRLRDSERQLNVETAQRRSEIEKLKMIAEDVTKSEEERLESAQKAFKIEQDLLDKRVENAEKAVEIAQQQVASSESSEEDLDNLAQLEINLANIRGESYTKQIELNNKINAINAETERKEQEAHDKKMQRIKDEKKAQEDLYDAQIAQADAWLAKVEKELDEEEQLNRDVANAKLDIAQDGLNIVGQLAGEGTQIAKVAGVAQATVSGIQGVQNAFTTASLSPITTLFPAYPFIQAGIAGAFSALQIQQILSAGSGGGGASSVSSVPSGGGGGAPSLGSMSGEFSGDIMQNNQQAPPPLQTFVVTDDMTNSQNKLATIRRRATI